MLKLFFFTSDTLSLSQYRVLLQLNTFVYSLSQFTGCTLLFFPNFLSPLFLAVIVATFLLLELEQLLIDLSLKLLKVRVYLREIFMNLVVLIMAHFSTQSFLVFCFSLNTDGWDEESPIPRCEEISATIQDTVVTHLVMRTHRAIKYCKRKWPSVNTLVSITKDGLFAFT